MNSLFLGVILSISSTTIILKTFDELGVKTQKFAGNVIGALIVQDILAILIMVLLSTVALQPPHSPVPSTSTGFKLTTVCIPYGLVVSATIRIIGIGPIARTKSIFST